MRSMLPVASAALAVAILFGAQSIAAGAKSETAAGESRVGQTVHFEGCVRRGVENGCLVVETDGKTYDVTSGAVVLKVDQYQAGTGVVSDKVGICMQGVILDNIVLDAKQPEGVCTQDKGKTP